MIYIGSMLSFEFTGLEVWYGSYWSSWCSHGHWTVPSWCRCTSSWKLTMAQPCFTTLSKARSVLGKTMFQLSAYPTFQFSACKVWASKSWLLLLACGRYGLAWVNSTVCGRYKLPLPSVEFEDVEGVWSSWQELTLFWVWTPQHEASTAWLSVWKAWVCKSWHWFSMLNLKIYTLS